MDKLGKESKQQMINQWVRAVGEVGMIWKLQKLCYDLLGLLDEESEWREIYTVTAACLEIQNSGHAQE